MVSIEKTGKAKCSLTGKESEGVFCSFADGSFKGFLSWRSLKMLLNLKSGSQK